MKKTLFLLLTFLALLPGCEVHDTVTESIKRKAIVYLTYHYDNGREQTFDGIESMRLFIYDHQGRLYRDTTLTPEQFLVDTGAMQTYISSGDYSIISWANVAQRTLVATAPLDQATLGIDPAGADPLMYGRIDTPVVKGDSLRFDVHLFKSVFKINVTVRGLRHALYPEEHYFSILNRSALSVANIPTGEMQEYRPPLTYHDGTLSGSFYTPYFAPGDDLTLGVYCSNPASPYRTLCQRTIREFADLTQTVLGRDVEIDVDILINDNSVEIIVTDWNGQQIQDEHVGA